MSRDTSKGAQPVLLAPRADSSNLGDWTSLNRPVLERGKASLGPPTTAQMWGRLATRPTAAPLPFDRRSSSAYNQSEQ